MSINYQNTLALACLSLTIVFTAGIEPAFSQSKNSPAASYRAKASAFESKYDFPNAISQYQKAYDLDKVNNLDYSGFDLCQIGSCDISIGRYADAIDILFKSLHIFTQTGNDGAAASAISNIGLAYDDSSQYYRALTCYQDALELKQQAGDKAGQSVALNNIGMVNIELGQYKKAVLFLQKSLSFSQQTGDKKGQLTALNNIGLAYGDSSEYKNALDYDQQALAIEVQTGDTVREATTTSNIASVYGDLSLYDKSLEYYQQALPIYQKTGDLENVAVTLNNIGQTYVAESLHDTALDYYQKSLLISQQIEYKAGAAIALNNIGEAYSVLGQYVKALPSLQQALQIDRQIGSMETQGNTLHNIGAAYDGLGEHAKALGFYQQALVARRQVGDKTGEAETLNNIMLACESLGKSGAAVFYGKLAVNITQSIRASITSMDAKSQSAYLGANAHIYRDLADLLIQEGRLPEAQQVLRMLKEREFYDYLNPSQAMQAPAMDSIALTKHEARWSSNYTNTEQILKDFSGKVTEDNTEGNTSNAFDVQGKLPKGTVALYTIVEPAKLDLIIITPDNSMSYTEPVTAEALYKDVFTLRQALTNPNIDPRPAAAVLYNLMLAPVQKDMDAAGAKSILFSLDDALRYVPPAALYNPQTKEYLAQRYQTQMITLVDSRPTAASTAKLSVLGMGVTASLDGDPPLPGVAAELAAIVHERGDTGGLLPGRRLIDAQFTQDALESQLKTGDYPIVHLASHFALSGTLDTSYLLLGDGTHLSVAELAKDPHRFQGVDLLTLSACQTAMEVRGSSGHEVEGVGALAQTLGAGSVLASLWPVSDAATPQLMTALYKYHQQNPTAPLTEALQAAQLSLLNQPMTVDTGNASRGVLPVPSQSERTDLPVFTPDPKAPYAHPYYWAPFILIGNWR